MEKALEIFDKIKKVREAGKVLSDHSVIYELDELEKKLKENKFFLVVTGLFKRGKSSIINSLIGREVAPVAVVPLTAIITVFENGNTDEAEVVFRDGHIRKVSLDDIYDYVTEKANPANEKEVSLIKVTLQGSQLLEKCCLVDTPGIGSVFDHNSETTYSYIPKIDAALFILGADVPIAKADAEFLKEIHTTVPRTIYVLNKTDLLDEIRLQEIIQFDKQVIHEITGEPYNEITLVRVSCKRENELPGTGNITGLFNTIDSLIDTEKNVIIQENSLKQLSSVSNQLRRLLEIEVQTLQMPVVAIDEKQKTLRESVANLKETRNEFDILVKGQVDYILERETRRITETVNSLKNEYFSKIKNYFEIGNISDVVVEQFAEELTSGILESLEKIKDQTEENIIQSFQKLMLKYQSRDQSFLNEFSKILNDIFGVGFEIIIQPFNLEIYSSFYFLKHIHGRTKKIKSGFFIKLLPLSYQKQHYMKTMKENVDALLEVNMNRMKSDISYKVNESYRRFTSNAKEQVQNIYEKIDKLLDETKAKKEPEESEIFDRVQKLKHAIEWLD